MVQLSYRTYNSYHWSSISLSQHNQTEQRKNSQCYLNEVSKGDCIIMGDFNHGNIKWDTLQSTGVEDSTFLCLVQDNFLTQHVLEPTRAARVVDRLAKSTRFPGRLPVFQHFYPSTRFLIFLPVFGIPISKQNCIFTDKYRRNS